MSVACGYYPRRGAAQSCAHVHKGHTRKRGTRSNLCIFTCVCVCADIYARDIDHSAAEHASVKDPVHMWQLHSEFEVNYSTRAERNY